MATLVVAATAVSCAADTPDLSLSPPAQEGQRLYGSSGCAGCHGGAGQGGVGPTLAGIAGTERELIDGSVVVADRDYLVRAIMEPDAEIVAGYSLRMPSNRLTADEVDAILAFIDELEPSS